MQNYAIKKDGINILIETIENEKNVERAKLYDLYCQLETAAGNKVDTKMNRVIKEIAYSLSEEDAKLMIEKFSASGFSLHTRVIAYAEKLIELKTILKPVDELIEAYEDYDFDSEMTVTINGNHFTYNPQQINIENIADKLFKLGEKHKDNYWRIEIDDNGEVVLHW